jgi:hypothetical protein
MNFRGSQCHGGLGVGPGLADRRFCPGEGRAFKFPPARRGRVGEPEMSPQAAADAGAARCDGSAACQVAAPGQGHAARGSERRGPAAGGPTASPRPGHRNLSASQRAVAAGELEGRHVS